MILKKLIFLLLFGLTISKSLFAQIAPSIQWQKALGGSLMDNARSVCITDDGGYIVAGSSNSMDGDVTPTHAGFEYWVVKLSSTGSIQWKKTYGGPSDDQAKSIQKTSDGGYIVVGTSNSNGGDVTDYIGPGFVCWVVKLSATGGIQWSKSFSDIVIDLSPKCIKQTSDGGYVIVGTAKLTYTNCDLWVLKIQSNGGLMWKKMFGGSLEDYGNDIIQANDGGFIITGETFSNDGDVSGIHGLNDAWIIKLNSTGILQWQKTSGGSGSDNSSSACKTNDGGFIITGRTKSTDGDLSGNSNYGNNDYWIAKFDSIGVFKWSKTYGCQGWEEAFSIEQTNDGGYVIAGQNSLNGGDITDNHGGWDYWIVKTDNIGTIQWTKSLGGTDLDYAYSIKQTNDLGYIVVGDTRSNNGDVTGNHGVNTSDIWIVKLQNPVVLPLKLIRFQAHQSNEKVVINWMTENENDLLKYQIQRSYDGFAYNTIDSLYAKNDLNSSYQYIDKIDGSVSSIYYRLKIINMNGLTQYSPISRVYISNNKQNIISLQAVNGYFNLNSTVSGEISIVNNVGQFCKSNKIEPGINVVSLKNLPKGIYFMTIKTSGQFVTRKIINN